MKPHLADLVQFWAEIGVSVEDQRRAASWAFPEPAAASEPGRADLPENRRIVWNELSGPADREQIQPPPAEFQAAVRALAEYGMLR